MPYLYQNAKGILLALKEKGIDVAIASRSPTPEIAKPFLDKLGIRSMFVAEVRETFPIFLSLCRLSDLCIEIICFRDCVEALLQLNWLFHAWFVPFIIFCRRFSPVGHIKLNISREFIGRQGCLSVQCSSLMMRIGTLKR